MAAAASLLAIGGRVNGQPPSNLGPPPAASGAPSSGLGQGSAMVTYTSAQCAVTTSPYAPTNSYHPTFVNARDGATLHGENRSQPFTLPLPPWGPLQRSAPNTPSGVSVRESMAIQRMVDHDDTEDEDEQ